MSIEKRLERLEAILDARGLDWDHPRVEEPAKEAELDGLPDIRTFAQPNLRWRILDPAEVVQEGDWVNALWNKPDEDPPGGGWIPARASLIGQEASQAMGLYVARPVADEPAKEPEPEHPPDPGEGYRILSKDPPEDLSPGDEYFGMWDGLWRESRDASEGIREQRETRWYRRKIEQPKPAEPEYREPVLPADEGKWCEFSEDGRLWFERKLLGYSCHLWLSVSIELGSKAWVHARIKKDA